MADKVLIVDDDPAICKMLSKVMDSNDLESDIANSGKEALNFIEKHNYDAILMDVMMPNLDGISAAKRIRAMDRKDAVTIPIIAMTANAFEEDAKECINAGMNAHMAKPLDMDVLIDMIAGYCNK